MVAGLDVHLSSVEGHNFFDNGQAEARPGDGFVSFSPVVAGPNMGQVFFSYALAMVCNGDDNSVFLFLLTDLNGRSRF